MRSHSSGLTRRAFLRSGTTVTALGVVGSLAGCAGPLGGSETTGLDRVGLVPGGATVVAGFDVAGMLDSEAFRGTVNQTLSPYADRGAGTPATVEAALDAIETEVGLDPRSLQKVLSFGVLDGTSPAGAVLWSAWSQSQFFEVLREGNGDRISESTYRDRTVLTLESSREPPLGVSTLAEGVFVIADAQSVETVLDLWDGEGDSDPVGGEVREAYTATEPGLVRFGFDVPTERIPEEADGPVDVTVFRDLTYGYGSLATDTSFTATLQATGETAASDVATVLDAAIGLARKSLGESSQSERLPAANRYLEALEGTSVDQQGDAVVVRIEEGGAVLALLGSVVGSFVLGVSAPQGPDAGGPSQSVPQVAFGFDYDTQARELAVVHEGGESVRVDELFVRGRGVDGGRWDRLGGSASAESDPPQVVAGDRLVLTDVPADHEVRIVWEPNADTSVTLASHRGPDA